PSRPGNRARNHRTKPRGPSPRTTARLRPSTGTERHMRLHIKPVHGLATPLAALGLCLPVAAQDAAAATVDKGDTTWMLVATILVIMMAIPGLALFYGGLVRAKNMLSVLMQVFGGFCLMALLWVAY